MSTVAPPPVLGLAHLARLVFEQADLQPTWNALAARAEADPTDAAALLDLSTLLLLTGQRDNGLALQAQALALQSAYHRPAPTAASLTVLAIVTPGDMMANTPIDFLLAGSDIALISLYVAPGLRLPQPLPAHDVAFLAIGESEATAPLLQAIAPLLPDWPAPLLNRDAGRIAARHALDLLDRGADAFGDRQCVIMARFWQEEGEAGIAQAAEQVVTTRVLA